MYVVLFGTMFTAWRLLPRGIMACKYRLSAFKSRSIRSFRERRWTDNARFVIVLSAWLVQCSTQQLPVFPTLHPGSRSIGVTRGYDDLGPEGCWVNTFHGVAASFASSGALQRALDVEGLSHPVLCCNSLPAVVFSRPGMRTIVQRLKYYSLTLWQSYFCWVFIDVWWNCRPGSKPFACHWHFG